MRRVFPLLLLLLLGWGLPASAEAPACGGRNLLDGLKLSDPAKYEAVLAEARAVPNGEAVLWKVEGNDGRKPSYLLGTAHVTDVRVTRGPPGFEALIAASDKVVLEIAELSDRMAMGKALMGSARRMVLPPGQSLWDLVPDADEPAIRNHANLPPGAAGTLYGYQPWVVSMMLANPLCEQDRVASGLKSFDESIALLAKSKGIGVAGLETLDEQFDVLSGAPVDLQVRYLVESAKLDGARIADNFETLLALYDRRQVTALIPLMKALDPPSEASDAMLARMESDLIVKRNHRMAERAEAFLTKGNAFIAVGALHLPGAEGLVELLRQAGYKVTPVN